jgi:fatty-acyl-CoA synthase
LTPKVAQLPLFGNANGVIASRFCKLRRRGLELCQQETPGEDQVAIATLADIEALERVPFERYRPEKSVFEVLARTADRHPGKLAMQYLAVPAPDAPTRDITYADFKRRIIQAANLFHRLGVGPSDAVSMLLPVLPETFFAMFGAQVAGMANPINFLLEPEHLAGLLREARCRVLIGPDPDVFPGVWNKIEAIRHQVPDIAAVIRVGGHPARPDIDALHFESALDRENGDALDFTRAIAVDDTASLFHTGGTTNLPKLARHTHRGLIVQSWSNAELMRPGPDEVYFNGLPPFHVGGATCAGLAPFANGATVVLLTAAGYRHPQVMANLWAFVARFRPTTLGMVPTSWGVALGLPRDGVDFSSIKLANSGGATMPVEIAKAVRAMLPAPLVEGWGMTETHGFSSMNPAAGESRIGSVGFRAPFTELVVARVADGRIAALCPPGEIGRVLTRGPQLFGGYVNPAHNRDAWVEPLAGEAVPAWSAGGRWFDTGDLGRFDADGYLWLTGRAKDMIIRGGHNIDPAVIEEVLHRHPAVEIAAAVGRPDAHAGEMPIAFVQLKLGVQATAEELHDFARLHIPERAAAPVEVVVLPAMPLTGVGKIFKPRLRHAAAQLVFERLARAALGPTARITVEVGPHPEHGTFAVVRVVGVDEAAVAELRAALRPFQLRHEVSAI